MRQYSRDEGEIAVFLVEMEAALGDKRFSLRVDKNTLKRFRDRMYRMLEEPDFEQGELAKRLHQNQSEILDLEWNLALLEEKITKVKAARDSDSMLQKFLLSKREATKDLNRVIYSLPPKEKKGLIEALVEGDIEIGDGLGDGEKWHILRMPLVFKPEAFKGLLGG